MTYQLQNYSIFWVGSEDGPRFFVSFLSPSGVLFSHEQSQALRFSPSDCSLWLPLVQRLLPFKVRVLTVIPSPPPPQPL